MEYKYDGNAPDRYQFLIDLQPVQIQSPNTATADDEVSEDEGSEDEGCTEAADLHRYHRRSSDKANNDVCGDYSTNTTISVGPTRQTDNCA